MGNGAPGGMGGLKRVTEIRPWERFPEPMGEHVKAVKTHSVVGIRMDPLY